MSPNSKYKHVLLVTAALALSSPALAQNKEVTDQANKVAEQANQLADEANELTTTVADDVQAGDPRRDAARDTDNEDDDGDSGKWGLLGLLGLAGLLGLKRGDRDRVEYRGTTTADRTRGRSDAGTTTDTRL